MFLKKSIVGKIYVGKVAVGKFGRNSEIIENFRKFQKYGAHFDNDARQMNFKDIDFVWAKFSNE